MDTIEYRPYQRDDADDVKGLINEAFYIHRYASASHLLASALEIYLRDCLASSTYAQVAVVQGRVVGILMGRVEGQPPLPGRLAHRLQLLAHMVKIGLTGFRERATLRQYFTFDRVYQTLRTKATVPLTDELTLFAVDASTRGHGVGKTLYENYLRHLRHHGRTDFYLYTDSLCTYQFYEKRGMNRAAEQSINLTFRDGTETVGVYLYSGKTR